MYSSMAPRGLRNNNPGNIRVSSAQTWQGEIRGAAKKDKDFCEFKEMRYGYRALIKLLQNYQRMYRLNTVAGLIGRWAPPNENNTANYARFVAQKLKVGVDDRIDTTDKTTATALAAAISEMENGVPAVSADIEEGWKIV